VGLVKMMVLRHSLKMLQSTSHQLQHGLNDVHRVPCSRVNRMGRWSVFGPCSAGAVSHEMMLSRRCSVPKMLSGLSPVACAA
jgi:hypothetical protein